MYFHSLGVKTAFIERLDSAAESALPEHSHCADLNPVCVGQVEKLMLSVGCLVDKKKQRVYF